MLEQCGFEYVNSYIEGIILRFDWLVDNGYTIKDSQIEIIGVPHQSMGIFEYIVGGRD